MTGLAHAKKRQSWLHGLAISLKRDWRLYLMMILPVIFYNYVPLYAHAWHRDRLPELQSVQGDCR